MEEKLQGIVLSVIRHSDSANIVSVFTRSRGRMAFISPVANSKSLRMRNASLQPLSIIEIVCRIKSGSELQRLGKVSPLSIYKDLYFNPLKCTVGIFLADFLNHILRETGPDEHLWQYICSSLNFLDLTHRNIANFHLAFIYGISLFVGIQPDTGNYRQGSIFDMLAGGYSSSLPLHKHYLSGNDAAMPMLLERMNFANFHKFKFSRDERNRILKTMIEYYDLHIPGVASMKSLPVLQTIFAGT